MKRLLTSPQTETFSRECAHNPVYRVICKAFQHIEWKRLCFSNEEICLGCFTTLDQIIPDKERAEDILAGLQQQMYREIKEQAQQSDREFCPQEAERAVRCVKLALLVCFAEWGEDGLPVNLTDKMALSVLCEDPDFVRPLMSRLVGAHARHREDFNAYIRSYVQGRDFLSLRFRDSSAPPCPAPPVLRDVPWQDTMERVRRHLAFMQGSCPTDTQECCMSRQDFELMMQALEYLVRRRQVMIPEHKLHTALRNSWLIRIFYLLSRDESVPIPKDLWIKFLKQTFQQLEENNSLSKHFADRVNACDKWMRGGRKA